MTVKVEDIKKILRERKKNIDEGGSGGSTELLENALSGADKSDINALRGLADIANQFGDLEARNMLLALISALENLPELEDMKDKKWRWVPGGWKSRGQAGSTMLPGRWIFE